MTGDMLPTVLFRVDGGNVWGVSLGHIRRCLLLAEALLPSYRSVFIMQDYSDGVAYVRSQGITVETIAIGCDDETPVISSLERLQPVCLFVDLVCSPYRELFRAARKRGITSVLFDIVGNAAGSPDYVVNDSLVKSFVTFAAISSSTRPLIGPDFFIMPPASAGLKPQKKVKRLLITFGGSDPAGLTTKVVAALKPLISGLGVTCTVVLGPTFSVDSEVHALTQDTPLFAVVKSPSQFMHLLAEQDVIISSAGRTLYECAHLGRPVVIVPSIEHEAATAEAFCKRIGYFNIGLWDERVSPDKLRRAIMGYCTDLSLRNSVYDAGKKLVDGRGIDRILKTVLR